MARKGVSFRVVEVIVGDRETRYWWKLVDREDFGTILARSDPDLLFDTRGLCEEAIERDVRPNCDAPIDPQTFVDTAA